MRDQNETNIKKKYFVEDNIRSLYHTYLEVTVTTIILIWK